MRGVQIAIVIPCYNTSSACVAVITQALATGAEVLVVDDGSTDDTPAHIAGTGVRVIRLPVNAGKGAALKAGIEEVLRGRDGLLGGTFDYILTMDGDGQHDAQEIPRFIELGTRERADLVIGVRNVQLMPPKSKVGNYISRVLFYLGTGRYVADTQSGFRLLLGHAGEGPARRRRVAALRDGGGVSVEGRDARLPRRDRRDSHHLFRRQPAHPFRSAVGLDARHRGAEPLRAVLARGDGGRHQRVRPGPPVCRRQRARPPCSRAPSRSWPTSS